MSYMFCEDLTEAVALEAQAKKEAAELRRELPAFITAPAGAIGISVQSVHYATCWAIEADLTRNGEDIRHNEAFDLLVLDLTALEMKAMLQSGVTERRASDG